MTIPNIHIPTHISTYVYVCMCNYTCIYVYIHIVCVYIYTYMYACTSLVGVLWRCRGLTNLDGKYAGTLTRIKLDACRASNLAVTIALSVCKCSILTPTSGSSSEPPARTGRFLLCCFQLWEHGPWECPGCIGALEAHSGEECTAQPTSLSRQLGITVETGTRFT